MKAYVPEEIKIAENRQRQEFDAEALEDLKQSIEGKQLLHPIVVREVEGSPTLVAGERRLRVIQDIYALGGYFFYDGARYDSTVPTVTLGELTELEAEEAELDENLKRKDLTWQESATAHTRLHRLRGLQKAAAVPADQPVLPQTTADTAQELFGRSDGDFQDRVRKELIVARHLHDPDVAKAKDVKEAFKILKSKETAEQNKQLAASVGKTFTAKLHNVVNANCLLWMLTAIGVNRQFDVILTDPPYGMGADQFGDGGGKLTGITHQYDDSHAAWQKLMGGRYVDFNFPAGWCELSFKVAKPQAHVYVFCDIDRYHELKRYMEKAGWYVHRTPLIDYKIDSGRVPLPDRGPRRQWEMILYAIKGDKPVTHIYSDVIPCKADENMTHGAQKPVSLYQNLLMRSVRPGDQVLDTFAGSGTIIEACHAMQCVATAIELEPAYYGMCLRRLQALKEAADPLEGLK